MSLATVEAATKADVQAVETKVDTWLAKQEKWLVNNWPHIVTWAGMAWAIVKHL